MEPDRIIRNILSLCKFIQIISYYFKAIHFSALARRFLFDLTRSLLNRNKFGVKKDFFFGKKGGFGKLDFCSEINLTIETENVTNEVP